MPLAEKALVIVLDVKIPNESIKDMQEYFPTYTNDRQPPGTRGEVLGITKVAGLVIVGHPNHMAVYHEDELDQIPFDP